MGSTIRLRYAATLNPSKSEVRDLAPDREVLFLPMEAVSELGEISEVATTRRLGEVYSGFTYFRPGDVLVAKITPCFENGKGALVPTNCAGGIGFGTTEFHVLRPSSGVFPAFLSYTTRSLRFRQEGAAHMKGAAGQQRVPTDFVKDYPLWLPPLPAQRAIAAFLDRKTAAIDALIEKKGRLIKLLAEKRVALIHRAVTKGLDPNVPMEDSGVPWIGDIPAGWEVRRVKHLVSFTTSGSRGWAEYYSESDDDPVFLQSGNLGSDLELDWTTVQRVSPPSGSEGVRTRLSEGDVLICITGAKTGNVAFVESLFAQTFINQHVALLRPIDRTVAGGYLAFALKANASTAQLEASQYGGTKQGLGLEDVRNVVVAVPPREDQDSLLLRLKRGLAVNLNASRLLGQQLDRLREYRQALITAAVTGQLQIPEEAA